MQTPTFNLQSARGLRHIFGGMILAVLLSILPIGALQGYAQKITQCSDGIDNQVGDGKDWGLGTNKGDGKADYYGVDTNNDGQLDMEPDPSCVSLADTTEEADDVAKGSLIPCTNKCTFADVFKLINGLLSFFIKTLLIPIFIIILMYAGFKYITAQGNPGKTANLKKMFGNMVLGLVLVLCSWLIVYTILTMLGYSEGLSLFS